MKRASLVLATLVVLLGAGVSCGADTTESAKPDSRLDVSVSITAKDRPVGDFLEDLSKQAGVPLSAHLSTKDRRVTVLVRDKPLRVVMEQLKALLDADWFTEKVGDSTGYYIQAYAWQFEAQRRRRERAERQKRELHDLVRRMVAAAGMSFSELQGLVDTDPVAAVQLAPMSDFSRRYALGFLAALPDEQFDTILSRKRTWIAYADLPPIGKKWVQEALPSQRSAAEEPPSVDIADEPGAATPRPVPVAALEDYSVEFRVSHAPYSAPDYSSWFLMWLSGPYGKFGTRLETAPRLRDSAMDDPRSASGAAERLGLTDEQFLEHLKKTEAGRAMISRMQALRERQGQERTLKAGIKAAKIELRDGEERSLAEVLGALRHVREFRDLDFTADSYLAKPGGLWPLGTSPRPAKPNAPVMIGAYVPKDPDKMLDHVAECFGRKWTRDNGIVRFRSPDWMEDLLSDPPAWLIERLRRRCEENGRLDFSDLVLIAQTLTDDQIQRLDNVTPDPAGLHSVWMTLSMVADLLRVYGSLSGQQQAAVFKGGIPGRAMTPEQASRFADYVQDRFDGKPTIGEAMDAILSARSKEIPWEREDGAAVTATAVDFTITLASGETRGARVNLPLAKGAAQPK